MREHALVDLAHLPRAGDHAAAVDTTQAEVGVLGQQQLGGELRGAVERARAGRAGTPRRSRADAPGRLLGELEARLVLAQRERAAARAIGYTRLVERKITCAPWRAGELEAVVGAEQVRVHDEVATAVEPGQHRRLGRALDERVELADVDAGRRAARTSPWTNATPASRSRGRLSSEPRRLSESSAVTCQSGWRRASAQATLAPTNPAPPVTVRRMSVDRLDGRHVAAREQRAGSRRTSAVAAAHRARRWSSRSPRSAVACGGRCSRTSRRSSRTARTAGRCWSSPRC